MIKLSDKMAADGHKPLCAGIESGDATGWPVTDWMEEVMLRKYGPDVYDQWTSPQHPVQRPQGRRRAEDRRLHPEEPEVRQRRHR